MPTSTDLDLSTRLDELPDLLPFPAVALKLMDACNDPNTGVRDLSQIIKCDASLSLKLLQISNCSLYGCAGQIRTVDEAAVLLGVRGLRDLALSTAAADMFSGDHEQTQTVQQLWLHSLGCATVARIIAEQVPNVSPDEAFVAGLVHDVGKLIFIEVLKDQYDLIPQALNGLPTIENEDRAYGVSHVELGSRCGEEWGLPAEISDAISNHHCPADATESVELTSIIAAANQISKIWNVGVKSEVELTVAEVLDQNDLTIDEATLAEMRNRAPTDFAVSQKAFGV